jgi:hypothetical protein
MRDIRVCPNKAFQTMKHILHLMMIASIFLANCTTVPTHNPICDSDTTEMVGDAVYRDENKLVGPSNPVRVRDNRAPVPKLFGKPGFLVGYGYYPENS